MSEKKTRSTKGRSTGIGDGGMGLDTRSSTSQDFGVATGVDTQPTTASDWSADLGADNVMGSGASMQTPNGDGASSKARDAIEQGKDEAEGMAKQAEAKADAGIQKSAEGLKKAADKARSASEDHSGTMGTIGAQAADALDKGADYLEHGDTEQFINDLESLVRRHPVESLVVAAGAGFLLSKAMR